MKFASEAKQIMKNELKININGCDYWGVYDGYDVYHNYNKYLPSIDGIVFEMDGRLYLNGEYVGKVDSGGRVNDWRPENGVRRKKNKVSFAVEQQKANVPQSFDADDSHEVDIILDGSWKRSIEDLVGKRLATYEKASS